MTKEPMIWIDGRFHPKSRASVSVFDHGLLYGDGVFEGIRSYDGLVFALDEHLDRLYNGAGRISLDIPISREEFAEAICETLRVNKLRDAYIRPVVTRGVGDLGLNPVMCPVPTVIIIADRLTLFPRSFYEEGIDVCLVKTRCNDPSAMPPEIKSLNYLTNILARLEVNACGKGEGLMLSADGFVAEGTADNLFVVRRGRIETPPVELGALPGITRGCIIEIAGKKGIEVVESRMRPEDLSLADEIFLTGTGAEIVPVRSLEDKLVGEGAPGPVTLDLMEEFRQLTRTRGKRID